MIFNLNGREIEVREEPLTGDELRAEGYIPALSKLLIDIRSLTDAEKNMTLGELIDSRSVDDPELFGRFDSYLKHADEFKTIMLCTSLSMKEIIALPSMTRLKLVDKCREALGGTAADFFCKLYGSSSSQKTAQEPNGNQNPNPSRLGK